MRPAHPSYKPSARQLQAELDALRLGKTGPADEGSGENGSRPSDNCKQKTVLVTLEVAEDVADAIRKGAARSVELMRRAVEHGHALYDDLEQGGDRISHPASKYLIVSAREAGETLSRLERALPLERNEEPGEELIRRVMM